MLDPMPATAEDSGRPEEPPEPPPPYEPGPIELAVLHDLSGFPEEFAKGAIAAAARKLAREMDMGYVIGRDAAGHAREIRQAMTVLREMAPGERKGDATDDLRARREARMQASGA
jgi:hypothetical protein